MHGKKELLKESWSALLAEVNEIRLVHHTCFIFADLLNDMLFSSVPGARGLIFG